MSNVSYEELGAGAKLVIKNMLRWFQAQYHDDWADLIEEQNELLLDLEEQEEMDIGSKITSTYKNLDPDDIINISIQVEDAARTLYNLYDELNEEEQKTYTIQVTDLHGEKEARLATAYFPVANPVQSGIGYAIAYEPIGGKNFYSLLKRGQDRNWRRVYESSSSANTPTTKKELIKLVCRWEAAFKTVREHKTNPKSDE